MTAQEIGVCVLGAAALVYLGWRLVRRRRAGTCCGEAECPAAKKLLRRLEGKVK